MTMPDLLKSDFAKPRSRFLFQDILPSGKRYIMRSDVKETDTMYQLDIDLPGFQKEDIKAYVRDNYLIIEATNSKESTDDSRKCIHKERYEGTYRRTFYVGSSLTQEDIKASYRHGVLHLHIPKKSLEDKKPDVITIN